jgi:hypothetical protein
MAKITGKNTRAGSNKATGRDYSKEKAYQSSPKRRAYRADLNAEARERGIYGKRASMSKDLSHTKDGKMVLESKSLNRRRQGANGKSTKK